MNKYIELIEKWLSDRDSVSSEELKANDAAAYVAYAASVAAEADADAAYAHTNVAANAAHAVYADDAAYYVTKYKELTK